MDKLDDVLQYIVDHGPCRSADLDAGETLSSGGWWDRHPSKAALEYLGRTGRLSVTRREAFHKVYEPTENMVPPDCLNIHPDKDHTIDWACRSALDRLGFATSGELTAF